MAGSSSAGPAAAASPGVPANLNQKSVRVLEARFEIPEVKDPAAKAGAEDGQAPAVTLQPADDQQQAVERQSEDGRRWAAERAAS